MPSRGSVSACEPACSFALPARAVRSFDGDRSVPGGYATWPGTWPRSLARGTRAVPSASTRTRHASVYDTVWHVVTDWNKRSKNFDAGPHHREGQIFTGTMSCDIDQLTAAIPLSFRYWRLNDPFCCVHRRRDSQGISMGRTTSKLPIPMGDLGFHLICYMVPWAQESAPVCFCTAHNNKLKFCYYVHPSVIPRLPSETVYRLNSHHTFMLVDSAPSNVTSRLIRSTDILIRKAQSSVILKIRLRHSRTV